MTLGFRAFFGPGLRFRVLRLSWGYLENKVYSLVIIIPKKRHKFLFFARGLSSV